MPTISFFCILLFCFCCRGLGQHFDRNQKGEIVSLYFSSGKAWNFFGQQGGHSRDFNKVESLTLQNQKVEGIYGIQYTFPALKYLTLGEAPEGVELDKRALEAALDPGFPRLKGFAICAANLRDSDLSVLPKLNTLEYLRIEARAGAPLGLSDDVASMIVELPELVELEISGKARFTDRFVESIAKLPKLKRLHLASDSFTDQCLVLLSKKAGLKVLSLSSASFTRGGLGAPLDSNSLEDVEIVSAGWKFRLEGPKRHWLDESTDEFEAGK